MPRKNEAPAASHEIESRVLDGIEVRLDMTYAKSWEGLVAAADMSSERLDESQRFMTAVRYYQQACPNIDDVLGALRAASPDREVSGSDVMEFVSRAIKDGTPKN